MKKFWQKYTIDAAKQVESKYFKPLVISLIISFILFMIFSCFKGKVADVVSNCCIDYVIFVFSDAFTAYLCSKKIVIWLSVLISIILTIIIFLLSIVWMFIADGYIMH